ncbi:Phosphopantothenoylcysteine decarboxylase, partial [Bienertia sinuspersici]
MSFLGSWSRMWDGDFVNWKLIENFKRGNSSWKNFLKEHCWQGSLVMAQGEPVTSLVEPVQTNTTPRRPRILLAASGSVAAIKFGNLCHCFSEWAEVKAVATKSALHFIDTLTIPEDVTFYTDEDEWSSWSKIGDNVLHIELRKWADIMVIAPLSANTLGK